MFPKTNLYERNLHRKRHATCSTFAILIYKIFTNLLDLNVRISIHPYTFILFIGLGTTRSITHDDEHIERSTRHTSPEPYVEENDNNDQPENGTSDEDEEDDADSDHSFEDAVQVEDDHDADLNPQAMDTEDDNRRCGSPQAGQKRPRRDSDSDPAQPDKFRKAIKVKNSRGKPKADDWEQDVQEILAKAIIFYEIRLATDGLFPDHMEEVNWAKVAWSDGCYDCDLKIHHNSELIKIVRLLLYRYPILIKHVSSRVVQHIFVVL